MRKPDGSMKLCIYSKIHTDQYFQFSSHPLYQKLDVIRTFLDRSDVFAMEVEDKEKKDQHFCQALELHQNDRPSLSWNCDECICRLSDEAVRVVHETTRRLTHGARYFCMKQEEQR